MSKNNGKSTRVIPINNNGYQEPTLNTLLSRAALVRAMTTTDRDIDKECGYPDIITPDDYWDMYRRNGIARKVVNFFPDECWSLSPEVYETEEQTETPFE